MNNPTSAQREACLLELLAEQGPVRVARCGCGTVHLSLGALTVRLPDLAYQQVVRTLLDARQRMAWETASVQ